MDPEHLGYINRIFEDTSDSRFRLWDIQKCKEVTEFIKKLRVYDMDVLSQEDIITYESLVQEVTREYRDLVDSKRWEPATSKVKSQDQPSLLKAYTVAIEQSINKALKQIDFKSRRSGNGSGSIRGSAYKQVTNIAGVNSNQAVYKANHDPMCPSCNEEEETCRHILGCDVEGRVKALNCTIDLLDK